MSEKHVTVSVGLEVGVEVRLLRTKHAIWRLRERRAKRVDEADAVVLERLVDDEDGDRHWTEHGTWVDWQAAHRELVGRESYWNTVDERVEKERGEREQKRAEDALVAGVVHYHVLVPETVGPETVKSAGLGANHLEADGSLRIWREVWVGKSDAQAFKEARLADVEGAAVVGAVGRELVVWGAYGCDRANIWSSVRGWRMGVLEARVLVKLGQKLGRVGWAEWAAGAPFVPELGEGQVETEEERTEREGAEKRWQAWSEQNKWAVRGDDW